MGIRKIGIAALALVLMGYGASLYRSGALSAWLSRSNQPAKPFVFDNGSVRDNMEELPVEVKSNTLQSPPGALRKCVRNGAVTYSNLDCPAGAQEQTIRANNVNVLPSLESKTQSSRNQEPGGAHTALREALDIKQDDQLRQRMMDRAIASGGK